MANVCCMTGCTVGPTQDVYYFKLPTKPTLRRRWLDVIKPDTKLSMDASVCSAHFDISDYETVRGKTRLKKNKVPMNVDEIKSKTSNDRSNQSTELSESTNKSTDKSKNKSKNKSTDKTTKKSTDKSTNKLDSTKASKGENGTSCEREIEIETGVGGKEIDSNTETAEVLVPNGQDMDKDPNSIEIQITPDIIEDYSTLQVTPDIIEDDITLKPPDPLDPDINETDHDIEDILTNYHIMNPPDRRDRGPETHAEPPAEPLAESTSEKPGKKGEEDIRINNHIINLPDRRYRQQSTSEKPGKKGKQGGESTKSKEPAKPSEPKEKPSEKLTDDSDVQMIDDDDDDLPLGVPSKPVFIEINVDKERAQEPGGDCLMVLESLQCSIDPTSLMLPEPDEIEEIEIDDKSDDDDRDKNRDPISLLTSSDSDEVIIEEPHVDCVSVSDETDEDDVPLVKLVKPRSKPDTRNVTKILWGMYDYYCKHCHFTTYSRTSYNAHLLTHSSSAVIQICQVCGYTTASEYQFTRHKKKHRDERRFKCHLCDYKARHNMSLLYHLKTHDHSKVYKCDRCLFRSNQKNKIAKHMESCMRKFSCGKCKYSTKRSSDLKRHMQRRHPEDDEWT